MKTTGKTTTKEFQRFKSRFLHWQERFGLHDWRIVFEHAQLSGCYADLNADVNGRVATVRFNLNVRHNCNPNPESHALHEAIHLLLARFGWLGACRYLDDNELREEEEALVRRLEKVLGRFD